MRMTVDLSSETMEARRNWHSISHVLKELSTQNCVIKESILKNEGERKAFSSDRKQISQQQAYPKRLAKENTFKQKGNNKKKTYLGASERNKELDKKKH
jgi:hypothetical protein